MDDREGDEYLSHFESSLGVLSKSWRKSDSRVDHFQILQFSHAQSRRITYVTFGLNRFELPLRSDKLGRQELVIGLESRWEQAEIPSLLTLVGEEIIHRNAALLRGEVVGPRGPLIKGLPFTAFYCSAPVYFPQRFEVFEGTNPATVTVWLVPIYSKEAEFIAEAGWPAFEDLLERKDPNLLDLSRPSLVV